MSHLARHCDHQLLHAAAWAEFSSHVASLRAAGKHEEVARLCRSVVEIQHLPITVGLERTQPGMQPVAQAVCCQDPCQRCSENRGGFRFPWVGTWTRRGTIVVPGSSAAEAWDRHSRVEGTLDLLELEMLGDEKTPADFSPPAWTRTVRLAADLLGCATRQQVFTLWRTWQLGCDVWQDPRQQGSSATGPRKQARRALVAWMEGAELLPRMHLAKPCFNCCTPCRRICGDCGQSYCSPCSRLSAKPICCPKDFQGEAIHAEVPPLQLGQRDADVFRTLVQAYQNRVNP